MAPMSTYYIYHSAIPLITILFDRLWKVKSSLPTTRIKFRHYFASNLMALPSRSMPVSMVASSTQEKFRRKAGDLIPVV